MRININKRNSTKAERIFYEILKKNHILFKFREKIEGKEIDFIIGKYIVEIDGHEQSAKRN
jgi:very-short-patch-repair endonuclease